MKTEKPKIEDYYQGEYSLVDLRTKWSNKQASRRNSFGIGEFSDTEFWTVVLTIVYSVIFFYEFGFEIWFFLYIFAAGVLATCTVGLFSLMFSPSQVFNYDEKKEFENLNEEDRILLEEIKSLERFEKDLFQWNNYNLETGYEYWNNLKGVALELAVSDLLERFGWSTEVTKKSGDGGIDLIIKKNGREILVQCKGHALNIGVGPIRDAAGVKSLHKKDFIVVGPSGFSKGAREFAEQSDIDLWDTQKLINVAKNGY